MSSISKTNLVTQVKLDLKEVIENLKLLENPDILDHKKLNDIKKKTQQLLKDLENKPLEKLKVKLKKQQIKRQRKKLHKTKQSQASVEVPQDTEHHNSTNEELTQHVATIRDNIKTPLQQSRKLHHHHHLRSLKECQRFLKTFELLEQLHLARGQEPTETRKFACKLQPLKSIWNCLLQEQQDEQLNDEEQIQQQWNQVLFGVEEKSFFEEKPNMKYFLRKRHIWDSFIDNKHGSAIPIGWVIPPITTNNEWSQYLAKE